MLTSFEPDPSDERFPMPSRYERRSAINKEKSIGRPNSLPTAAFIPSIPRPDVNSQSNYFEKMYCRTPVAHAAAKCRHTDSDVPVIRLISHRNISPGKRTP